MRAARGGIDDRLQPDTERLRLRALGPRAAPRTLDYYRRNVEHRRPWTPIPPDDFLTLEAQRTRLAADREAARAGQSLKLWMTRRDDPETGPLLGFAALSNIVRGAFQSGHLGYEVDALHVGRGYATEAVAAILDIAFGPLGLHRVEANVIPRNHASRRVVEKLGFVEEGLARRFLLINGVWEDHVQYVRLADD